MADVTIGRRERSARRRLLPAVAVMVVVGALLVGVQLSHDALQQRLAEATHRTEVLEQALRSEQLRAARAALLATDTEQRIADQLAALESTDGFLR